MKYIYKLLLLSFIFTGITSCEKNENFEILAPQGGITINSPIDGSSISLIDTNVANPALTISWISTNLEGTGATYTVEAALLGTEFAVPFVIGTTEATSINFTVEELNTLALDVLEIAGDTQAGIDIRVAANGEVSQTISVLLTPYKVEFTEFYIVGNITDPQWSPADALAMTNIGFNEFELTLDLADGAEFKFLPTNIDYTGDFGEDPNNAGNLIEDGEQNLSGYAAGTYKIYVNLNTFIFTLEEILDLPRLAVPGNHQGWSPSTAPQLSASTLSTTDYEGYVWLDGEHKFVGPDAEGIFDWSAGPDYGDDGSFTGILKEQDESNCTATAGYYFIQADTNALTYSETEVLWGIIGSATPGDWTTDTDLIYDPATKTLSADMDLIAGAFKFRGNNEWDNGFDLGNVDSNGYLQNGGDLTFDGVDGNYHVVLDLSNPRAYTYSITPNS